MSTLTSEANMQSYRLSLDDLASLHCDLELDLLPVPATLQELSDRAAKIAQLQAAEAAAAEAATQAAVTAAEAAEAAARDAATLELASNVDEPMEAISKQVAEIGIQVDLMLPTPPPAPVPRIAETPTETKSKYGLYAEDDEEDEDRAETSVAPNNAWPTSTTNGLDRARKRTRTENGGPSTSMPTFTTAKVQLELQEKEKQEKGFARNGSHQLRSGFPPQNTINYGNMGATANGGMLTNLSSKQKGRITNKFKPPLKKDTPDAAKAKESLSIDLNNARLKNIEPRMIETIKNEIMDSVPQVEWKDISGLEHAKETITEAVTWPLLRPDLFTGLRRPLKGLLLFGPPGTGKTMIGKCIASHSKATFFNISSSSLTSKWIGDGEKMVRALFAVARCHQPAVIFMDEIDSLLTQRSDNENEASRRIKTEFLIQFDGVGTTGEDDRLLLVGATNRPQEIDEAARRRFGKRLYIPLPELGGRTDMVTNLLGNQGHDLTPQQIRDIGEKTDGYSGSDIKGLCKEAAYGPIRSIKGSIMDIDLTALRPINHGDFLDALFQVRASVSDRDLEMYHQWDQEYGSVAKKVDKAALVVKVLDKEARTRQLRHHLDSLERDNFVALNEYEAIIATAAAAASAPGPVSLTTTNLGPHGLLPPMSPAVGSLVGGIAGTLGPGATMPGSGPTLGSRSKKQAGAGAIGANNTPSSYAALGHRKPVLPRKPLNQLLEESGMTRQDPAIVSYLTASMGPSQYPHRQFCSAPSWIVRKLDILVYYYPVYYSGDQYNFLPPFDQ
ncbi:hypothetical protein BGZ74_008643 [Mortierella antarctica]|nr:hypothetical protein BGZ74_008643 [Mortierella antarctica]